ncbi:hypothetical protein BDQ17DRAFT_1363378 [Cyathus striatus]|nr:hypothetical protein BDQ17DRAFT_1363378 [Cyathus striatus]
MASVYVGEVHWPCPLDDQLCSWMRVLLSVTSVLVCFLCVTFGLYLCIWTTTTCYLLRIKTRMYRFVICSRFRHVEAIESSGWAVVRWMVGE